MKVTKYYYILCSERKKMENEKIITQCDRCGQFQNDDESWDGIHREIIRTGNYSHGPCPECFKKVMEELESINVYPEN